MCLQSTFRPITILSIVRCECSLEMWIRVYCLQSLRLRAVRGYTCVNRSMVRYCGIPAMGFQSASSNSDLYCCLCGNKIHRYPNIVKNCVNCFIILLFLHPHNEASFGEIKIHSNMQGFNWL